MFSHFKTNYEFYEKLTNSKQHLDGTAIKDPFKDPFRLKTFQYKNLLEKIEDLKKKFCDTKEDTKITAAQSDEPVDTLTTSYNKIAKEIISSEEEKFFINEDNWDNIVEEMDEAFGVDTYESESEGENQE